MGFTARRLVWPAAAMAGVAAILGILAVLQYRWTTQISDNERIAVARLVTPQLLATCFQHTECLR